MCTPLLLEIVTWESLSILWQIKLSVTCWVCNIFHALTVKHKLVDSPVGRRWEKGGGGWIFSSSLRTYHYYSVFKSQLSSISVSSLLTAAVQRWLSVDLLSARPVNSGVDLEKKINELSVGIFSLDRIWRAAKTNNFWLWCFGHCSDAFMLLVVTLVISDWT